MGGDLGQQPSFLFVHTAAIMRKLSPIGLFWTTYEFISDTYLTIFTIFFRAGGSAWSPSVNAIKAVSVVTLIQGLFLLGVVSWTDVLLGKPSHLRIVKWQVVSLYVIFFLTNQYLLVRCRYGIAFEHEFNEIRKSKRTRLLSAGWLIIVGTWLFCLSGASYHADLFQH